MDLTVCLRCGTKLDDLGGNMSGTNYYLDLHCPACGTMHWVVYSNGNIDCDWSEEEEH